MEFLGRARECQLLQRWSEKTERSFLSVLYGRRRIGKTRLVEESFNDVKLYKFEGLQAQATREQQRLFLSRLAEATGKNELRLIQSASWTDLLILLSQVLGDEPAVVFFDEFQWMAGERTKLVSSLKYVWDNYFAKRNRVHLILCGSVCSFLVRKVIHSKALYGRINLEMNLGPLPLPDIRHVFHPERSLQEVAELYMAVGGVPQYLEMVDPKRSVRANLCDLCFSPEGYLVQEFDRIFASHFGSNQHYRRLVMALAKRPNASRQELQKACRVDSGGRITECLENLEAAGFIEKYSPVDRPDAQRTIRFRVSDPYVRFYFRFIHPSRRKIQQPQGSLDFAQFVPDAKYRVWAGLAFEHLCRQHSRRIAERLGFGAVNFEAGSWFSKSADGAGAQIDLLFLRADRVATVCEIRFQAAKIGKGIVREIDQKVQTLRVPRGYTVERVLISASPITADLEREGYFNRVLYLDDLFGK